MLGALFLKPSHVSQQWPSHLARSTFGVMYYASTIDFFARFSLEDIYNVW